jgi:hypothetical protein
MGITLGIKDKEKVELIADEWETTVSGAIRRLIQQFDLDSLKD